MTLGQEAAQSIRAVLRLVRRDETAFEDFNISVDGFWRSFFAAVLVAPLHFAWSYYEFGATAGQHGVGLSRYLLVDLITYVLTWTGWPLLMFYVTRAMGCGDRFLHYAIVYNWVQVPGVILLIGVAMGLGPLLGPLAGLLIYLVLGAVLVFEWWLAMKTLQISPMAALAVEAGAYLFVSFAGYAESIVRVAGSA